MRKPLDNYNNLYYIDCMKGENHNEILQKMDCVICVRLLAGCALLHRFCLVNNCRQGKGYHVGFDFYRFNSGLAALGYNRIAPMFFFNF